MVWPLRARRVCSQPIIDVFGPLSQEPKTRVGLTLEEYGTIRLIGLLDCTQEECTTQMGVARTTAQTVYNSARKKPADCPTNGEQLQVQGDNYRLCLESGSCCGKNCGECRCQKRCHSNRPGGEFDENCNNIRE